MNNVGQCQTGAPQKEDQQVGGDVPAGRAHGNVHRDHDRQGVGHGEFGAYVTARKDTKDLLRIRPGCVAVYVILLCPVITASASFTAEGSLSFTFSGKYEQTVGGRLKYDGGWSAEAKLELGLALDLTFAIDILIWKERFAFRVLDTTIPLWQANGTLADLFVSTYPAPAATGHYTEVAIAA